MKMSEEQYKAWQDRQESAKQEIRERRKQKPGKQTAPVKNGAQSKIKRYSGKAIARHKPTPGQMNKTEKRYLDQILEPGVRRGKYTSARFEALKLRLADRTFYTPDFVVINAETGHIEIHEIKGGYITEDGRMKWKIAAEQFPEFHWMLVQQKKVTEPFEVIDER